MNQVEAIIFVKTYTFKLNAKNIISSLFNAVTFKNQNNYSSLLRFAV